MRRGEYRERGNPINRGGGRGNRGNRGNRGRGLGGRVRGTPQATAGRTGTGIIEPKGWATEPWARTEMGTVDPMGGTLESYDPFAPGGYNYNQEDERTIMGWAGRGQGGNSRKFSRGGGHKYTEKSGNSVDSVDTGNSGNNQPTAQDLIKLLNSFDNLPTVPSQDIYVVTYNQVCRERKQLESRKKGINREEQDNLKKEKRNKDKISKLEKRIQDLKRELETAPDHQKIKLKHKLGDQENRLEKELGNREIQSDAQWKRGKSEGGKMVPKYAPKYPQFMNKDKYENYRKQQVDRPARYKMFEEHVQDRNAEEGLKIGKYFLGEFRINQYNKNIAYVTVKGIPNDVKISDYKSQNRAFHYDEVYVQLQPLEKWSKIQNEVETEIPLEVSDMEEEEKELEVGGDNEDEEQEEIKEVEESEESRKPDEVEDDDDDDDENNWEDVEGSSSSKSEEETENKEDSASNPDPEEGESLGPKQDSEIDYVADVPQSSLKKEEWDVFAGAEGEESSELNTEQKDEILFEGLHEYLPKLQAQSPGIKNENENLDENKTDKISAKQTVNEEKRVWKVNRDKQNTDENLLSLNNNLKELVPKSQFKDISGLTAEELLEYYGTFKNLRPLGKVVRIKESKNWNNVQIFFIKKNKKKDVGNSIFGTPMNSYLPKMRLSKVPPEYKEDIESNTNPGLRYYSGKYIFWGTNHGIPKGEIIECTGKAGEIATEEQRILTQYQIETFPESPEVLESLNKFMTETTYDEINSRYIIPESEYRDRLDFRDKCVFTIDPSTARDLDDAVHVERISENIYEFGVHIADVTYFLQPNTKLDDIAKNRATSVYFIHKMLPMLPRVLTESFCSLTPKFDKLSFSCVFRLDNEGQLISTFKPIFGKSVIHSRAKWNYELVQGIIDGNITKVEDIEEELRPNDMEFDRMKRDCLLMNEITMKRRAWRFETNGSLSLGKKQLTFQLDENQLPLSYTEQKPCASKGLIEELMLIANQLVGKQILRVCKEQTLLRNHPQIKVDKQIGLMKYFEENGLDINLNSSLELQNSLEKLGKISPVKHICTMKRILINLQMAEYIWMGNYQPDMWDVIARHYALNFDVYTHFTSPIRRYPDVIVHRLLQYSLDIESGKGQHLDINYSEITKDMSRKYMAAKRAGTDCQKNILGGHKDMEGYIIDVTPSSIQICIEEFDIIRIVSYMDLKRDNVLSFSYNKNEHYVELTMRSSNGQPGANKTPKYKKKQQKYKKMEGLVGEKTTGSVEESKEESKVDLDSGDIVQPNVLRIRVFDLVKVRLECTKEPPIELTLHLIDPNEGEIITPEIENKGEIITPEIETTQEIITQEITQEIITQEIITQEKSDSDSEGIVELQGDSDIVLHE